MAELKIERFKYESKELRTYDKGMTVEEYFTLP